MKGEFKMNEKKEVFVSTSRLAEILCELNVFEGVKKGDLYVELGRDTKFPQIKIARRSGRDTVINKRMYYGHWRLWNRIIDSVVSPFTVLLNDGKYYTINNITTHIINIIGLILIDEFGTTASSLFKSDESMINVTCSEDYSGLVLSETTLSKVFNSDGTNDCFVAMYNRLKRNKLDELYLSIDEGVKLN